MATIIAPFTAVDGNGHVRANARLYFYETGTSTPQNTFSDAALSVTNTNPVVADSNGLFAAIYLGDPPDFAAYKAILKTSADVTVWTADPYAGAPITSPISASLLRGYLSGLQRTANTTTTLTQGAGVCADDTNTSMLSLAAGTINCATVGADGLDAGALANSTWYHTYAIGKTDGTVARLASTSASSPTMPSGYTLKRRTGSFRTNGSAQIIDFVQDGDDFSWASPPRDMSSTNPGISAVLASATNLPLGVRVRAILQGRIANLNTSGALFTRIYFSDPATTDLAPTLTGVSDGPTYLNGTGSVTRDGERFSIWTNTSQQIRYRLEYSDANVSVFANVIGWMDRRGKDD